MRFTPRFDQSDGQMALGGAWYIRTRCIDVDAGKVPVQVIHRAVGFRRYAG